jgi:hypothetical protein
MADHRVQGVDRLVGESERRATEGQVEERRHDPVGAGLGDRFGHRPSHAALVEILDVAPDHQAHALAGARQVTRVERTDHGPCVFEQAAGGEGRPSE